MIIEMMPKGRLEPPRVYPPPVSGMDAGTVGRSFLFVIARHLLQ